MLFNNNVMSIVHAYGVSLLDWTEILSENKSRITNWWSNKSDAQKKPNSVALQLCSLYYGYQELVALFKALFWI